MEAKKVHRRPRGTIFWLATLQGLCYMATGYITLADGRNNVYLASRVVLGGLGVIMLVLGLVYIALNCYYCMATAKPILSNHGDTVYDFIRNVRTEKYEYAAIFLTPEQKLYEHSFLCRSEVDDTPECEALFNQYPGQLLVVHNHPRSNQGFSQGDFNNMMKYGYRQSLVIGRGYLYLLTRTEFSPRLKKPSPIWVSFSVDWTKFWSRFTHRKELLALPKTERAAQRGAYGYEKAAKLYGMKFHMIPYIKKKSIS